MKKMQIFEPSMCCSTGLCGVGVDSELLRISTVLNTMEKNGIAVKRFNLSNNPQEFVTNNVVNAFIKEKGVDELPVTVLDDKIVITDRYPQNEEIVKLLNIPMSYVGSQPEEIKSARKESNGCDCGCSCGCSDGGCGCSDSGCC